MANDDQRDPVTSMLVEPADPAWTSDDGFDLTGLPAEHAYRLGYATADMVKAEVRRAEQRGYHWAVAAMRDRVAYERWRAADMAEGSTSHSWPDWHHAPRFADYLEDTYPTPCTTSRRTRVTADGLHRITETGPCVLAEHDDTVPHETPDGRQWRWGHGGGTVTNSAPAPDAPPMGAPGCTCPWNNGYVLPHRATHHIACASLQKTHANVDACLGHTPPGHRDDRLSP